jgi:hypothetical protein
MRITLSAAILCASLIVPGVSCPVYAAILHDGTVAKPYTLDVARVSDKALRLQWSKVDAADGYEVFRYSKEKKKYVRVKTVKGGSKTSWTDRKLTSNRKYSYKLRSYAATGSGKVYSGFTYVVSAVANKASYKKVNAAAIESVKSLEVGINEAVKITGKALPSKKDRKAKKKVLSSKVRLMVSATGHATKDAKGRLVGALPGNANVYLMAHNGYKKKIDVKVVDYGLVSQWKNLNQVDSYPAQFLKDYKDDICFIASYMSQHRPEYYGYMLYDGNRDVFVNYSDIAMGDAEESIRNILVDSPYPVCLEIWPDGSVKFTFAAPDNRLVFYKILFDTQRELTEEELGSHSRIAPHWEYWREKSSGI